MKIKFLGTGAAEGIPALYCKCRVCQNARRIRGKEYRRRTAILVNEDLLVDYGPDAVEASYQFSVDYTQVKVILISHSHFDHITMANFLYRLEKYRKDNVKLEDKILIICNKLVYKNIINFINTLDDISKKDFLQKYIFESVNPYSEVVVGKYKIYALPSNHETDEICLLFIISDGKSTIFYSTDAKYYNLSEVVIPEKYYPIDMLIFDCTYGLKKMEGRHMGVSECMNIYNDMNKGGVINEETKVLLTHFSHCCGNTYNELKTILNGEKMYVTYDGLEIEIGNSSSII